jgi:adenylate cyclase
MQQQRLKSFILLSAISSIFVLSLSALGLFSDLELILWDARLRYISTKSNPNPKIKIIMIDQASIDHYAQEEQITWPWPRSMYRPIVEFLKRSGARALAFDIIFSESSSYGVEDDQELASAIESAMPIVSAVVLSSSDRQLELERYNLFQERMLAKSIPDTLIGAKAKNYSSAILPITELLKSSHTFGNVSAEPDHDGTFRHYTAGALLKGQPVLSLPFALFSQVYPVQESVSYLDSVRDRDGRLALRFAGAAGSFDTVNVRSVIESALLHEQAISSEVRNAGSDRKGAEALLRADYFKDALVFIGISAAGLLDSRPTPIARVYPGVEYNATVLDNLIDRKFITKSTNLINSLLTFIAIGLSTACAIFISSIALQIGLVLLIFGSFVLLGWGLASVGIWLIMAPTFVGMLLALLSALAIQYYFEGRQHRFIKAAFRHYLSPDLVEQISKQPELLALGGEKRQLTMLFTDLEGFTEFSEQHDPKQVTIIMNRYLTAMTDVVLEHAGTLDKYIGDAIMAFWNAPLVCTNHHQRAVEAALEYQVRLASLREELQREFGFKPYARIGVHTGEVSVGNFGSLKRFNYTVIGDAVNLASRLEGANKVFGTYTLVSESCAKSCWNSFVWRKVADVQVVGRRESIVVYEPLVKIEGLTAELKKQIDTWQSFLQAFEKADFDLAYQISADMRAEPLLSNYLERIKEDSEEFGSTPHDRLARGWRSVWTLVEK